MFRLNPKIYRQKSAQQPEHFDLCSMQKKSQQSIVTDDQINVKPNGVVFINFLK